jgi:hypothetical protein
MNSAEVQTMRRSIPGMGAQSSSKDVSWVSSGRLASAVQRSFAARSNK